MGEKVSPIDRRKFLQGMGLGAASIVGLGVLNGCVQSPSDTTGSATESQDTTSADVTAEVDAPTGNALAAPNGNWLGTAPEVDDSSYQEIKEADVVIVGAGVAGISAARAAAEAGVSTIVVEQTEEIVVRGLVFGALDSSYQKSLGAVYDNNEVVNEICKAMGNRPNASLWKKWADESGPAFDWFTEALDDSDTYFLEFWPTPEKYSNESELRKQYCTGIEFTDWVGAVTKHYNKSVNDGAEYVFNMKAVKLAQDSDGTVTGVYTQNANGEYIKFSASKGVILCTGDYGHNVDMVKALCPEFYWNCGGTGTEIETSNGDGHKLAIWAGGMMEPSPHAHMDHTFADMMGIGNTATLNLTTKGKRYMNEDCDGQAFTNQMVRQPNKTGIQVFDSTWSEMIQNQPISHGMPNPVTADLVAMQAAMDAAIVEPSTFLAGFNTLEELFEFMELPVEESLASVERYNQLCEAGKDVDFGKRADRMYPIETPPFYASSSILATGVMTAGVVVDANLQVVDENYDPIPRLWAAGNVAGGRYACEYPVSPVVATSHGTAITFGRSCGLLAAQA